MEGYNKPQNSNFEETRVASNGNQFTVKISPAANAKEQQSTHMVCLDWDNTVVDGHMHNKCNKNSTPDHQLSIDQIKTIMGAENNDITSILRNPDEIKEIIQNAQDNGIPVAIVSHSSFPNAIQETLKEFLGDAADNITIATCAVQKGASGETERINKSLMMDQVRQAHGIGDEHKENVVLVDDDQKNITNVKAADYQGIHALKGQSDHIESIRQLVSNFINEEKENKQKTEKESHEEGSPEQDSPEKKSPDKDKGKGILKAIAKVIDMVLGAFGIPPIASILTKIASVLGISSPDKEQNQDSSQSQSNNKERSTENKQETEKESPEQDSPEKDKGKGILKAIAKVIDMVLGAFGIPPIASILTKIASALGISSPDKEQNQDSSQSQSNNKERSTENNKERGNGIDHTPSRGYTRQNHSSVVDTGFSGERAQQSTVPNDTNIWKPINLQDNSKAVTTSRNPNELQKELPKEPPGLQAPTKPLPAEPPPLPPKENVNKQPIYENTKGLQQIEQSPAAPPTPPKNHGTHQGSDLANIARAGVGMSGGSINDTKSVGAPSQSGSQQQSPLGTAR